MEQMDRRKFIKSNVAAAAALSLSGPLQAETGEGAAVKVGFAKTDISGCIKSETKFRRPLEAICAAINGGETTTVLIALDLIEMPPRDCRAIAEQVSGLTKIAAENILIHTTHTHSAPWGERESGQQIVGLAAALADCVSQAVARARPARLRAGASDVGKTLSVYRRGDAGAELGIQTFWFGYTFGEGDDRPDASALVNEMKSRWLRKKPDYTPGPEPVWFDGEVDSLVQVLSFEDTKGEPIGCIVRFSAHPHLTCACSEWLYDPDYPGVVREAVEKQTGAPVMFVSGACGNLVPKEKVKYVIDWDKVPEFPYMGPSSAFDPADDNELLAEVERIGTAIARAATDALNNSAAEEIRSFKFACGDFGVPIDAALPRSSEEVECIREALVSEYEAALNQQSPLRELRGLANRLNWLEWAAPFAMDVLTDEERAAGEKKLPIAAVALDSSVLVFMHSEISVETTFALRKRYADLNLWTVGLTGGCVGYFPTAEMIDEGGYEGRSTVVAREAEEKLRKDISNLLRGMNVA